VRCDLFGDEIESIQDLFPATQRTLEPVGRAVVTPACSIFLPMKRGPPSSRNVDSGPGSGRRAHPSGTPGAPSGAVRGRRRQPRPAGAGSLPCARRCPAVGLLPTPAPGRGPGPVEEALREFHLVQEKAYRACWNCRRCVPPGPTTIRPRWFSNALEGRKPVGFSRFRQTSDDRRPDEVEPLPPPMDLPGSRS